MGKLYGISVGPGDPELMTMKACRIINEVDFLFCPTKAEGVDSVAFEIVKPNLTNPKVKQVDLIYPMHYQEGNLKNMWKFNGEMISELLTGEVTGAFITLGDSTVFSTLMYTVPYLDRKRVELEVVPGVPSFCAVAGRLGIPLVEWEENLMIFPVRKNSATRLTEAIQNSDNLVLMKPSADQAALVEAIRANDLDGKFVLVSKAGTSEERHVTSLSELETTSIPYLSTMIIKKNGLFHDQ